MVKRRTGVVFIAALFLLIGAAFLTQVVPYRQIIESQRRVETARAELEQLESENEVLSAEVAALNTDSEIEKLAREKLGYVKPGEDAYVVLDPPASSEEPELPPAPATLPERRTWVDRLWDFISGGDLAE